MPAPKIAVVVPCYNTSSRCADVIARTTPLVDAVLAVDDGSTDDTAEHLRASGCPVLRLPVNAGKGAALAAGFREALKRDGGLLGVRADYVVTVDGDGQHDPSDIPRLIASARGTGADLVLGVRDPSAMPRKNRIGAHYSRLLFLIGTSTFVADTQSGFRALSVPLIAALLDRVTWKGYESESAVLRLTIALERTLSAVAVSTIYIDGNRTSQFNPWSDSVRIASVFAMPLRWTVSMAMLDFALFAALSLAGWAPWRANVLSRVTAVGCQATLRRDYASRTRRLVHREGRGWVLLAFGGHLALTTVLLGLLIGLGLPPIAAKAPAQLVGYLVSFAAIDHVLLRRVSRARR